ncbi:MAG: hypothetical protein ABW360_12555 [Phenylobacterium sp.]
MIALLLATQIAAAAPADRPADLVLRAPSHSFVTRIYPPTRRCQGAARFQTSDLLGVEPTLLLRPQDRIAPHKLKDLPPATGCLTANPQEAFR